MENFPTVLGSKFFYNVTAAQLGREGACRIAERTEPVVFMVRTRGGAVAEPPPTTSKSLLDSFISAAAEAAPSPWTCETCTFDNRIQDRNCQMCGKRDRRRRKASAIATKRKAEMKSRVNANARKRKKSRKKSRVSLLPSPSTSPRNEASTSPDSVVMAEDTEQQLVREEITRRILGVASRAGQIPDSVTKMRSCGDRSSDDGPTELSIGTRVLVYKEGKWVRCSVAEQKTENVYIVSWDSKPGDNDSAMASEGSKRCEKPKTATSTVTLFGPKAVLWRSA
eukprot:g723.t1